MNRAVRRMKLFSLSSCAITLCTIPAIFIYSDSKRKVPACTVIFMTSTLTTFLFQSLAKRYVTKITWTPSKAPQPLLSDKLMMHRFSLFGQDFAVPVKIQNLVAESSTKWRNRDGSDIYFVAYESPKDENNLSRVYELIKKD